MPLNHRAAATLAAAFCLLALAACDPQRISELQPGVSTEADVRDRFGAPENVWDEPGGARTFGAIRERIPGSTGPSATQGVAVEVGERQAAIDIDVVVEYGVSIVDLSQAIRRNVIASVERMTGLEVTEVNITVHDVFVEGENDDDAPAEARVE